MSYRLEFTKTALADIHKHRKAGDRGLLRKLETLLRELMEHPSTGTGQPEVLKHGLAGLHSRRINGKHRLVYRIEEAVVTVIVLSAHGHYWDR